LRGTDKETRYGYFNLLFLLTIVFIPFSTSVMSEYGDTKPGVIFYAASLAAAGMSLVLIIWYSASDNRLVADDFDHGLSRHLIYQYLNMAGIFLVSIGIVFINVTAAPYFWLLIWPNSYLIDQRRNRKLKQAV
jgi:uncharacterized membrane protein